MKLSELVQYFNELDALDCSRCFFSYQRQLDAMVHTATQNTAANWPKLFKNLTDARHALDLSFEQFTANLDAIRSHARHSILEQQHDCFRESTRLWKEEMPFESNDYILNRKLATGSATDTEIHGKLLRWANWQFPGAIIRPGHETWIDHLVALDPLYLIDNRKSLLDPVMDRFPEKYQNRLRPYAVTEAGHQPILSCLPDNQFALFFVYNFFHFRPIEIICKWISEIYTKLRPGGILFFTFNDCDFGQGVGLYEQRFMCYTPGHMLVQHAVDTGFVLTERRMAEGNVAWLELLKPGKLKSMRAGQTLAKIVARSK